MGHTDMINDAWEQPHTGVVVGNYGYFATASYWYSNCRVLKVNIETMSLLPGCLSIDWTSGWLPRDSTASLVASGAYVYLLTEGCEQHRWDGTQCGTLSKIRQSDLTVESSVSVPNSAATSMSTDGMGYAYIGTTRTEIVKVKLSTLALLGTLDLGTRTTNTFFTSYTHSGTGYFGVTSVDGKLFGVSLNSGTDSLPVVMATAIGALTISETGYASGSFPPSGTKNTQTLMLQTEETVHGTTNAELSEGIADLTPIATCTSCIRYNLSILTIKKTQK